MEERTVYRACNLCEAICGLEIKVRGEQILSIRGDDADPFSRGHICPKGVALQELHEDPDRLHRPLKREGSEWVEISWDEAFELAADRISNIQKTRGADSVAFYAGNPSVHNVGTLLGITNLARTIRTRNAYSATSVDQLPQQLVSYFMFGHQFLIPIPDIDRTNYFLILGGNPVASNGSIMTVPDVTKRLRAISSRGGKVVVIDPRRTETADIASEHHFIRPATDAAFLMAMLNVIREDDPSAIQRIASVNHLDVALDAIREMTPERAAAITGIEAETIRRIAREFAASPSAVCYGRIGTTLQAFGTLNQWLVQLVNLTTGNLDREGGALPATPLIPITGPGSRQGHYAQWRSRVSGYPESGGELPVAALAEEILTPGDGQIRGLITICGNPVLSTPDGRRLDQALDDLDFMISVDIYLNETTRHADLILPPASSLNHDHYDLTFNALAVRNVARFNEAIWPRHEDERYDWEIFGELCTRLAALAGRSAPPMPPTSAIIEGLLARGTAIHGVTLQTLKDSPHGIDLGALIPSLFSRLETTDGSIECAPAVILDDVQRFLSLSTPGGSGAGFLLIGRRHLRSNNSWMHNSLRLTKGASRSQLQMHPEDVSAMNASDGDLVEITGPAGSLVAPLQATDRVMRGVVSLPHGFGHQREGTRLRIASQYGGVSYNDLTGGSVDAVSGNAALNGVPVTIRLAAPTGQPAREYSNAAQSSDATDATH